MIQWQNCMKNQYCCCSIQYSEIEYIPRRDHFGECLSISRLEGTCRRRPDCTQMSFVSGHLFRRRRILQTQQSANVKSKTARLYKLVLKISIESIRSNKRPFIESSSSSSSSLKLDVNICKLIELTKNTSQFLPHLQ